MKQLLPFAKHLGILGTTAMLVLPQGASATEGVLGQGVRTSVHHWGLRPCPAQTLV